VVGLKQSDTTTRHLSIRHTTLERQSLFESHRQRRWLTYWSYLVAAGGFGALLSAVVIGRIGQSLRPARAMLLFGAGGYVALMLFVHTTTLAMGVPLLMLAGLSQGVGQTAMATLLIRSCDARFRGRLMGIRMLMIYGNILGLMLAGWLIPRLGYPLTATLYGALALLLGVIVTVRWRTHLWQREAAANTP